MNPLTRAARCRTFVHTLWLVCGLLLVSTGRVNAQLIYADSFSYPDGLIDSLPGSPWVMNYPATNNMSVISGQLYLTETNTESVRYDFPTGYVKGALYARMVVNVSKLPAGSGNFFAFFRQDHVDNLRARIWVTADSSPPGKFRFGLTSILSPPFLFPQDFPLGTNVTLVVRYAITNANTTLWINPTDESDTSNRIDDTRFFDTSGMGHFGFAQTRPGQGGTGNDMGALTVDDLRIGRTFAEVMPLSKITSITNTPGTGVQLQAIGQATTNYIFQATTNLVSGNWVNLSTNTANTNGNFNVSDPEATNFPSRFYRLLKQ